MRFTCFLCFIFALFFITQIGAHYNDAFYVDPLSAFQWNAETYKATGHFYIIHLLSNSIVVNGSAVIAINGTAQKIKLDLGPAGQYLIDSEVSYVWNPAQPNKCFNTSKTFSDQQAYYQHVKHVSTSILPKRGIIRSFSGRPKDAHACNDEEIGVNIITYRDNYKIIKWTFAQTSDGTELTKVQGTIEFTKYKKHKPISSDFELPSPCSDPDAIEEFCPSDSLAIRNLFLF